MRLVVLQPGPEIGAMRPALQAMGSGFMIRGIINSLVSNDRDPFWN